MLRVREINIARPEIELVRSSTTVMHEWLARALLQHRIRVRLGELELAEGAIGRLTHHEMLPGGVNVPKAALHSEFARGEPSTQMAPV